MSQNSAAVIVIVFVCLQVATSCKNEDTNVLSCTSFADFEKAGSNAELKTLTLKNYGNETQITLKNDAFANVPNLETLVLDGLVNKLEPFAFRGLKKLQRLKLENIPIEDLPDGIFDNLPLENIAIVNSKLKSVKVKYFSKLKELQMLLLLNGSIASIDDCAFCELKKLGYLILAYNELKSFEPVRVLGLNSILKGINLDDNELTIIPRFDNTPLLQGATFINNSIDKIEENCFTKCPNIQLIDVSFNNVTDIPSNIFPDATSKDEPFFLIMHNTNIQCLSSEVRNKILKLRRITVNDNPWKCECLQDVITWAQKLKAYVGCDYFSSCVVTCVDSNNVSKNVTLNYP